MDGVLVVVYSLTGTGQRVAKLLEQTRGWRVAQIRDLHRRAGWLGNLRCMLDSLMRRKPAIEYLGPDPAGFAAVVLVSPVWMLRMAGPMRSFLAHYGHSVQDAAIVCVMGGSGAPNVAAEAGAYLNHAPLLSTFFTAREVEDGSCAARVGVFAGALEAMLRGPQTALREAQWSPQAG